VSDREIQAVVGLVVFVLACGAAWASHDYKRKACVTVCAPKEAHYSVWFYSTCECGP